MSPEQLSLPAVPSAASAVIAAPPSATRPPPPPPADQNQAAAPRWCAGSVVARAATAGRVGRLGFRRASSWPRNRGSLPILRRRAPLSRLGIRIQVAFTINYHPPNLCIDTPAARNPKFLKKTCGNTEIRSRLSGPQFWLYCFRGRESAIANSRHISGVAVHDQFDD